MPPYNRFSSQLYLMGGRWLSPLLSLDLLLIGSGKKNRATSLLSARFLFGNLSQSCNSFVTRFITSLRYTGVCLARPGKVSPGKQQVNSRQKFCVGEEP